MTLQAEIVTADRLRAGDRLCYVDHGTDRDYELADVEIEDDRVWLTSPGSVGWPGRRVWVLPTTKFVRKKVDATINMRPDLA